MARGKEAASAARRRHEAALQLAERLADKNAELKARTRKVETDASHLPAVRRRIAELERQVAACTSPELERERAKRQAESEESAMLIGLLRKAVRDLYAQAEKVIDSDGAWIPAWIVLQRAELGVVLLPTIANRRSRRVQENNDTRDDRGENKVQDNRKRMTENDDAGHGFARGPVYKNPVLVP